MGARGEENGSGTALAGKDLPELLIRYLSIGNYFQDSHCNGSMAMYIVEPTLAMSCPSVKLLL